MKLPKINIKEIFIGFILSLLGLGILGFALRAYQKIQSGHGLDYYTSGRGYHFNYIGVFILFLTIPLVLIIGWLFGKYLTWRDKKLERQLIENRLSKAKSKRKRKS